MIEAKYVYLKAHPLFCELDEAQILESCRRMKVSTVYRGENIDYGYGHYSRIFFVLKGKVKIAESNDMGDELIKDLLTEGECFGDLNLEGMPSQEEYAEALTANCSIGSFSAADFKMILQNHSGMALKFAKLVGNRLRRMENRHADLVFRDARSRLIRFIKNWARTDGSRVGDKIVLNNYLTHTDIACIISTSRQSVNVLFNELRDSGMIFYNRKRIELNDPIVWN